MNHVKQVFERYSSLVVIDIIQNNEIGPQVVVKVAHNKHPFDYVDLRSVPVLPIVAKNLIFAHALGKPRSTVRYGSSFTHFLVRSIDECDVLIPSSFS